MPESHDIPERNLSVVPERPNPVAVFIFGIMSLTGCSIFLAIPALVTGNRALKIEESYSEAEALFIKAGRIMGIISIWIFVIALALALIFKPSPRRNDDFAPYYGAISSPGFF